jgi:amino acid adenylation domain-containing protein
MASTLHALLSRAAREHPERIAVEDGDRSLTYAELEAGANRMANLLTSLGVARGDRVGVYLEKSLEAVTSIYGVLKAGAVYVPLDPRVPISRLAYIASDCTIRVLIAGIEKSDGWSELVGSGTRLDAIVVPNAAEVDAPAGKEARVLTSGDVEAHDPTPPEDVTIGLDLAYILYTSGSTGAPKGVMLTHLNALTFVRWVVERYAIGTDDRLSSHAPFHFDLSILDLYAASAAGATVVLVPAELSVFPVLIRDLIRDRRLTVWYSVPSVLTMLVERGGVDDGAFPDLRTLFFAGEVFPTRYLRRLMRMLPHVRFVNLYGPTETNVCTFHDVEPIPDEQTDPIPIGRAIDDVEVFAITDDGRPAEPGEVGELYVRGTTVMQGYWGDTERTGQALVPDPLAPHLRDLVYRTGDLVQQGDDGEYRLLGRRDHQIKSRGYRIELGEIEAALYAHPGVLECAAVAIPDPLVTNRIVAYMVGRDGLTADELTTFCADRIPRYMLPERFEFARALPRTSTGKVDRQALLETLSPAHEARSTERTGEP